MRPADTTGDPGQLTEIPPQAWENIERIDCTTDQEEAGVVALVMRGVLAAGSGDLTCALVTPDRQLARRVAAELSRWQVDIDDSAGKPLADTPPGLFLRLVARAFAERFAPVPLLAMLKHPLARGGEDAGVFRNRVRQLERTTGPTRPTRPSRDPRPGCGGSRAGWRGDVGCMKWSGWLGTMYVDDRTVIEGTVLTGTALDPIQYQVATIFDEPWNFLVGSLLEVTSSIHLMAELGFGDREQFTCVASYRF